MLAFATAARRLAPVGRRVLASFMLALVLCLVLAGRGWAQVPAFTQAVSWGER